MEQTMPREPLFERLQPAFDRMDGAWRQAKTASQAGQAQQAMSLFQGGVTPAADQLREDLREEYYYNKANADRSAAAALSFTTAARNWAWMLLGAAV